jgi:starvation-inducible DNA-binding protein
MAGDDLLDRVGSEAPAALKSEFCENPHETNGATLMDHVSHEPSCEARYAGITDLPEQATRDISAALRTLLADVFVVYLKTKNFHWHMSRAHFRDYHLLLDEHGAQIFAMTDPIAERARKLGGMALRSIGQIGRLQRIPDNDADYVEPRDMLAELKDDNVRLTSSMRQVYQTCEDYNDVATASLLEVWIDETERRAWFLRETVSR